jgi:hypothetical protein
MTYYALIFIGEIWVNMGDNIKSLKIALFSVQDVHKDNADYLCCCKLYGDTVLLGGDKFNEAGTTPKGYMQMPSPNPIQIRKINKKAIFRGTNNEKGYPQDRLSQLWDCVQQHDIGSGKHPSWREAK